MLWALTASPGHAQVFQDLYDFTGGADGSGPGGALIQASDGHFYGTTMWGPGYNDYGTVFRITPEGAFTTVFTFNWTNGAVPCGALLQGADGDFYGTTLEGYGSGGSVFKLTSAGELTTLAWFLPGSEPVGDLAQGADHKLYGVSKYGGDYSSGGFLFRVSTNGEVENLHLFYGDDGRYPSGGLLLASDGNFYGVTGAGGVCTGDGSIYRLTSNGEFTTIASFCQGPGNAVWPRGKLLQAEDGNFYGAAGGGGRQSLGAVREES
jgi:uncharacterized repeat protein (TIGR03803 family)